MKLRSAGDSIRGSPQPFDHRMPLSHWRAAGPRAGPATRGRQARCV